MDIDCEPSTSTSEILCNSTRNSVFSSEWWSATDQPDFSLDALPDDVLLELFSYLNSCDLSKLCVCSLKIDRICKEYGQWRNIRAYCDGSRPSHDHLQSNFTDSTTHIKVSSNKKVSLRRRQRRLKSSCLKPEFFKNLENSPKLESFILENHSFDIEMFSLNYFPESLTELRLNGSHIYRTSRNWKTVFLDMHEKLPNLEILDLSRCYWMKSPVLSRIFQCRKIKTLILFGCRKLDIPGFINSSLPSPPPIMLSLETFDLRKTEVQLEDLGDWPHFPRLKTFLLHPVIGEPSFMDPTDVFDIVRFLKDVETLVIRNNALVITDSLLEKLGTDCQSLKYLDITGTLFSVSSVIQFQNERPDVKLLN